MAYDILIKSGSVFDGTGNQPTVADVGIRGNEISAVGDLGDASAKTIVNAYGKFVTPGFIDITNHSDTHLTLFRYPNLESLVMQGITTVIGGNCGASLAPLGSPQAINAIRKWADPTDINLNWAPVAEFLSTVEHYRPGVNFGTCIGYGTLRRGVVGNEARQFTFEEQGQVKELLRAGMRDGAFGLSLGLVYGHERVAPLEEIVETARVLAEYHGVLKIHLRSEGMEFLSSVNEAIRIGREAGVSVEISHLKVIGKKAWPLFEKGLHLIERAHASGLDITYDVSPYNTTGSSLYLLIPEWARYGGFTELFRRIDDRKERENIIADLKKRTLHYENILVTSAKIKSVVGKTVAEIAKSGGLSNEDALLDLVRSCEGRVTILGRAVSRKNMEIAIQNKNSFIASDGPGYSLEATRTENLAHPRSFGAFPHFWHIFTRDKNLLTTEEAIRKMTSGPATKLGIKKRGILKERNFADIIVFDPRLFQDRARYKNPYQYPVGIEWVLINGALAVEHGQFRETRAGMVLKHGE